MLNPPTLEPQHISANKSKSTSRSETPRNKKSSDREEARKQRGSPSASTSNYSGVRRIESLLKKAEKDLSSICGDAEKNFDDCENGELFACGRKNGIQESAGQRILQIATIIRNLSFEEDNAVILSKNLTCLRYGYRIYKYRKYNK